MIWSTSNNKPPYFIAGGWGWAAAKEKDKRAARTFNTRETVKQEAEYSGLKGLWVCTDYLHAR